MMELEQRAVLELLPDLAGKVTLDLACGSGRYLTMLSERGAAPVVGLDISPHMLARAQTNPCYLVQADLRQLPLANSSFEVIVCGLAVGHVDDLRGVMIEVERVLVSGGIVVYSDFHPFGSLAGEKRTFRAQNGREYAARHHTHLYADHHAACRAAGLVIEEVREPRIDFEHKQRGFPAVLVIRARKT
jgi:malonyl-CoA O-methyltransferase